jgi:hypothetical protein
MSELATCIDREEFAEHFFLLQIAQSLYWALFVREQFGHSPSSPSKYLFKWNSHKVFPDIDSFRQSQ